MAGGKKSKKSIKKPARPVASVSIAKKVDPAETATSTSGAGSGTGGVEGSSAKDGNEGKKIGEGLLGKDGGEGENVGPGVGEGVNNNGGEGGTGVGGEDDELDISKVEERYLSGLAERIKIGVEKEVGRAVKMYEYEKRLAKTFDSYRWEDSELESRSLSAALQYFDFPSLNPSLPSSTSTTSIPIFDPLSASSEEKAIQKVAVLFGTLEKLGFDKERVDECVRRVRNLDVEEGLDWLYLHCTAEELIRTEVPKPPEYGPDPSIASSSSFYIDTTPQTPHTPHTPGIQTPASLFSPTTTTTPIPNLPPIPLTSSTPATENGTSTPPPATPATTTAATRTKSFLLSATASPFTPMTPTSATPTSMRTRSDTAGSGTSTPGGIGEVVGKGMPPVAEERIESSSSLRSSDETEISRENKNKNNETLGSGLGLGILSADVNELDERLRREKEQGNEEAQNDEDEWDHNDQDVNDDESQLNNSQRSHTNGVENGGNQRDGNNDDDNDNDTDTHNNNNNTNTDNNAHVDNNTIQDGGEDSQSSSPSPTPGRFSTTTTDTLDEDPNSAYADLRLKIEKVKGEGAYSNGEKKKNNNKKQQKNSNAAAAGASTILDPEKMMELEKLEKKKKEAEGHYFFKKEEADHLYRTWRKKIEAGRREEIASGLGRGGKKPERKNTGGSSNNSAKVGESPPRKTTTIAGGDGVNGDRDKSGGIEYGDEEEGGMFGAMLDEMPKEEITETGTTVTVRDMALSKKWSGKSPQVILRELVRRLDKFGTTTFQVVSSSRAVRAKVTIRWDNGKTNVFEMNEEACHDEVQANNYISTVALFAISTTPVHRQLPPAFRELWEELDGKKKEMEEEGWRQNVKVYKSIAEDREKAFGGLVQLPKPVKSETAGRGTYDEGPIQPIMTATPEQVMYEMAIRQTWPSYQQMLMQRSGLPIAAYRQSIMAAIEEHQVMVLCGETGCGKSTQVPAFILEHEMLRGNPVRVFCTEPRRISAISLAQRVSRELGDPPGACGTRSSLVGYAIRLESKVSANSRLVYATTGIVLRMLEGGGALEEVTHIIIDEVHERSIESDFLLIVLRQMMKIRPDLKIILMSATVDAEKIAKYMGKNCPVLTVPGRTFPVEAYFLEDVVETTQYQLDADSDSPYTDKSFRKAGKARKAEWEDIGGEDEDVERTEGGETASATQYSTTTRKTLSVMDHYMINYELIIMLLERICLTHPILIERFSTATLIFMPSLESIRRLTEFLESHPVFGTNGFLIFPLHSSISNENQAAVFDIPPPGVRKIVVATNIAETGITIPDITCVIDTGKHREMMYDEKRQISRLVESFIAKSNAAQRRGRAGRVQEGIAFHLFTRSRLELMPDHPQPEMLRLSLQDLALRIKIMRLGEGKIEDVLSQALDPPSSVNIQRAIASLIEAKALTPTEDITPLGRHLVKMPMDVHMAKFLIFACLFECLDAALTIAATLNAKTPFITPFGREQEADRAKRSFKVNNSDFLTLYNAYCSWRDSCTNNRYREFCRKNFLSHQNFLQIEELRGQYFNYLLDAGFITQPIDDETLNNPYYQQHQRQNPQPPRPHASSYLVRLGRLRTRFLQVPSFVNSRSKDGSTVMACLAVAMWPKLLLIENPGGGKGSGGLRTLANNAPAFIHPSSINFAQGSGRKVDWGGAKYLTFFTIIRSTKLYVWESGTVDELAVLLLGGDADFKLPAPSLSIDKKIRTRLHPKTAMAFKSIRRGFAQAFQAKMKNPARPLLESQRVWFELVREALKGEAVDEEERKKIQEEGNKKDVKISLERFSDA